MNVMKFIFNDGGRTAAGYQGFAGDCVARAIAIAAQLPYQEVYAKLCDINASSGSKAKCAGKRSARNGVDTKSGHFKYYLSSLGWRWTPTMGIGTGCKVHLRDGELPAGRLIVAVSKHYAAVIDGVIHDTHDCSREGSRCVYGYWTKP